MTTTSQNHSLRLREGQRLLIQGCPFEIKEITHRALFIEPVKRVRYTVACAVMQVHTWPDYPAISDNGRLLDGNEELALDLAFHPRAAKLMQKRKSFIVIACDEPYYEQAYRLIRRREKAIGRWSEEDEYRFQDVIKTWKENYEKNTVFSRIGDFARVWGQRLARWISLNAHRDASRGSG